MNIFAASDLHLAKSGDKPMEIFGKQWFDHASRICKSWAQTVCEDDIVLVPGDLSWAMKLDEAYTDLLDIMRLPGRKVFIRGNHDYWWNAIGKIRSKFSEFENAYFLQNDSVVIDGIAFTGSRGWTSPQSAEYKKSSDEAIYNRELFRLEMALKTIPENIHKRIVLLHFPPVVDGKETGFSRLAQQYGAQHVVYGHLHGFSTTMAFEGNLNGVNYTLCSLDHINFSPLKIDVCF